MIAIPQRIVAYIESNRTGSGADFAKSKRFATRSLILTRAPESYPPGYFGDAEIVVVDTADLGAVMNACATIDPAAIWSSSELGITIAAEVAAARGLIGVDPQAVSLCRDKARQRDALFATGVAVPATATIDGPSTNSHPSVQALTPRLVVKPSDGTGSIDVRSFEDAESACAYADHLQRRDGGDRPLLVQEFIDGPEFSLEMFNGRVVAVMRKHLSPGDTFVETGHDCRGAGDAPAHRELVACATAAVHGLGLTRGPAHVELRQGPQGPVVIEVNPRLAGGQIPAVIKQALGVDLISETLRWLLGGQPRLHPIRNVGAAIRFVLADRAGTLLDVAGAEEARRTAGIVEVSVSAPGTAVNLGDFRQRVGYVIGVGKEVAIAAQAADQAASLLKPVISPQTAVPAGARR
jgi:S-sulfo-L-cysteine synthase (3-phospho-L-serine-dependent)